MEGGSFSNKLILEACVETFEQAVLAEKSGAHRIELCADLSVGGVTPSKSLIEKVIQAVQIPVMVMVRPRSGDFVFSKKEMDEMKMTIQFCRKVGVNGIVIGNLNDDGKINVLQTQDLCEWAEGLSATFHKAIDETPDLIESVKILKNIKGVNRVLTSGGKKTALEGASVINKMIEMAGKELEIISAGKVTSDNLKEVHEKIGGKEYHGRRIVF